MPIAIDEFSIKPLYLEAYLEREELLVATGFVVKKNDLYYLITNWHVVTSRDPIDNRPLSNAGIADPNILKVWFHGLELGHWIQKEINIIDQGGNPLWLEHIRGKEIEVVAIPVEISSDVNIYEIDLALANFDLKLYPSEAVSIIGFPEGLTSGGKFPIWKTGHIIILPILKFRDLNIVMPYIFDFKFTFFSR